MMSVGKTTEGFEWRSHGKEGLIYISVLLDAKVMIN